MKLLTVIVLGSIITIVSGAHLIREKQGEDVWESKNAAVFKVRILKRPEKYDIFLPGARYVFQSASVSSKEWAEIMTFRHDDPVAIPQDQVRFVNDKIGYVFMGWKYAVTINGGATWSTWDAVQNLQGWKCCHYKLIEDVRVELDGNGTMFLTPDLQRQGLSKLYTKDYGRHWNAK